MALAPILIPLNAPNTNPPARQHSHGIVRPRAGSIGGTIRVLDLSESGPTRLRFPKSREGAAEGILVNTAGGIACGGIFETAITLETGPNFVLITTAAEKIYRSDGSVSSVSNRVTLASGAKLAWLPQETILFDRAHLRRRFEADLAGDASLLIAEIVAFGRAAHGETITQGLFEDAWRIRRDGGLAYADTFRLEGPIGALLARPAIGSGASACATILALSPGAEARLDEARAILDAEGAAPTIEAAASAWNGHLAIRMLGRDIGSLHLFTARFLTTYRGAPIPRVRQS